MSVITVTGTYREEDAHHALIFVDMLGFSALTTRHIVRVVDRELEPGKLTTSTTPIQTQINRFQRVLDQVIATQMQYGGLSAQIFSDCAYVDAGRLVSRSIQVSIELMRAFVVADVPVRIGIGFGTFYSFKQSLEQVEGHIVAKALFAGTGVVFANSAERCGGKGCRIFVHGSAEESLKRHRVDTCLLPLPEQLKGVRHEVCYLREHAVDPSIGCAYRNENDLDHDLVLIRHVRQMEADSEPVDDDVRVHYSDTLHAIDRMRSLMKRKTTLQQAAANEQYRIDHRYDPPGDGSDSD